MCEKLKDRYVVECKKGGEMAREMIVNFIPVDRYVEALLGIWDTFY